MSFTGEEGEQINIEAAAAMTKNYRNNSPAGSILSHYVGKNLINDILGQQGCVGIRMYHGLDENGIKQIVLVGVGANEDDLHEGIIVDRSVLCPPRCPGLNPLNSDE